MIPTYFGFLEVFGWVLLLGIFWPVTLGYAINKLTNNLKATTIIMSIITATTIYFSITTPYALNIFVYAAIISIASALFAWMYEMAS